MNVEMNITTIREYQPTDKNAVIDLIRQNTPAYFAPKEEADFSNYLDSERELYFVLLLKYRIEILKSIDGIQKITVRTSQLAYKFYEKQGFTLKEIQRDYWAKGFDMYSMEYNGH